MRGQFIDVAGAIQKRIIRMKMKVGELCSHSLILGFAGGPRWAEENGGQKLGGGLMRRPSSPAASSLPGKTEYAHPVVVGDLAQGGVVEAVFA